MQPTQIDQTREFAERKLAVVAATPYLTTRARRALSIVEDMLAGGTEPIRSKVWNNKAVFLIDGTSPYTICHDNRLWSCTCPDFTHRIGPSPCKHILAIWVLSRLAGMAAPYPVLEDCAACKGKFPTRELQAVEPTHLTFFEGDLLCPECAGKHGLE